MAEGYEPMPVEDVVSKKISGTLNTNGSVEITLSNVGTGILLLSVFGQNIERGYILPLFMANKWANGVGTVLFDYAYQTESQAVTITRNSNVITITNGTSVSVTYKLTIISVYR